MKNKNFLCLVFVLLIILVMTIEVQGETVINFHNVLTGMLGHCEEFSVKNQWKESAECYADLVRYVDRHDFKKDDKFLAEFFNEMNERSAAADLTVGDLNYIGQKYIDLAKQHIEDSQMRDMTEFYIEAVVGKSVSELKAVKEPNIKRIND